MPKILLTELSVRGLCLPARGQVTYWDRQLTGFGIRVSQGGTKTFCVVHGAKRQRLTIGRYPLVPLTAARKRARELLLSASLNPNKQPSLPFPEVRRRYLTSRKPEIRASSYAEITRHFDKHFLWDKSVDAITARDTIDTLDAISALSERRHAYAILKTFFNWCVAREYCEKNPLATVPKPKASPPRERVLDGQEIRAVWTATAAMEPYHIMVRLLLLTGQRANQIASLQEDWIDYDGKVINFPAWIMKSNQQQRLPFGPLIEQHLRTAVPQNGHLFSRTGTGFAFDNWGRNKKQLDRVCPVRGWTHHDLRRTWATHSAQLDTAPHIIERVLAHSTGTISKIAAIYNRFKYEEQMREAILRYEAHVVHLCAAMNVLTPPGPTPRLVVSA